MRIGLTGATGFVGRYIARHLIDQGHSLQCWFRPASDRSGLEDLATSLQWVPGDLADADSAHALAANCQAVVHAALSSWMGFQESALFAVRKTPVFATAKT